MKFHGSILAPLFAKVPSPSTIPARPALMSEQSTLSLPTRDYMQRERKKKSQGVINSSRLGKQLKRGTLYEIYQLDA